VAKGADCKSAGLRLRRFESYLLHHSKNSPFILQSSRRPRSHLASRRENRSSLAVLVAATFLCKPGYWPLSISPGPF